MGAIEGERLGVIDLGSNTFHLTVATVGRGRRIARLSDEKVRVGLGRDAGGALHPGSVDRARAALATLVVAARRIEGVRLVGVATSALREASNGAEFVTDAAAEHGFPIRVLAGSEEARLCWEAARWEISERGPVAVVDLGGGSLEVAVGDEVCGFTASLPLGVLRLKTRFGHGRVMGAAELNAIEAHVAQEAREVARQVRSLRPQHLVLTAGTAKAIARVLVGEPRGLVTRQALGALVADVQDRPPEHLAALGVESTRCESLGTGAAVLATFMELLEFAVGRVSTLGLREGVLLREAARLSDKEFPIFLGGSAP